MSNELDRIREEIEDLHQFWTDWISGNCPNTDEEFQKRAIDRLSEGCVVIMPAGESYPFEVFAPFMKSEHGSNPKFKIKIRNVKIRHHIDSVYVVSYEEWQRDAIQSHPNNGRQSTVVLKDRGDDFEWCLVHETWLPEETQEAGPYDF